MVVACGVGRARDSGELRLGLEDRACAGACAGDGLGEVCRCYGQLQALHRNYRRLVRRDGMGTSAGGVSGPEPRYELA